MSSTTSIETRHFTVKGTISSSAGGVISFATYSAADAIATLGSEWTNFAQEFQQFRPIWFEAQFFPATVNATSVTGPYQGAVQLSPWQQFRPSTTTTIDQAVDLATFSTLEEYRIRVQPHFTNERLWTPVGTTLAVDRDFGIAYASAGATLALSSVIYTSIIRFAAAFQVPQ